MDMVLEQQSLLETMDMVHLKLQLCQLLINH